MDNFVDFSHVIGATSGEHSNMLGKFLYFSLSNVLVNKQELQELCDSRNSIRSTAGTTRVHVK